MEYSGLEIRRGRSGLEIKVWESSTYGDDPRRKYGVRRSEGLRQGPKESWHLMDGGRSGPYREDGKVAGYFRK